MKLQRLLKIVSLVTLLMFASLSVMANPVIPVPTRPVIPTFTPKAPKLKASAYIMIDAASGKVIAENNADKRLPPASLTKLMTMYIVSGALKNGSIRPDDKILISKKAWKTEGSRMFVKVGEEVPVKELIQGIIVVSGNDAAVALSEHIAGSEENFTDLMNQQAKLLGMENTNFTDSTGLPHEDHYSTARDLATLARAYIQNFPEDYNIYSEKQYTHNKIKQYNRNRLLWRYQFADGLKTGHTKEAGYCLVGSAKKNGMRLITVVLGEPNDSARTEDSIRLLTYGFRFYETHKLYNADKALTQARVWKGSKGQIPLGVAQDFYVTVPTGQYKKLKATMDLNTPIMAPIEKGRQYGTLNITVGDKVIASAPLIALENDETGGLLRRAADTVKYNIHKYFSSGTNAQLNRG